MAHIQDRKSNFYSQKQSIRDESSAPQYLESAGDVLIKDLAKKQTRTDITLEEQLEVVQNFEKGFELSPDNQRGIASLHEFKKRVSGDERPASESSEKPEDPRDLDELMRITGLTRHELELSLCEKPNSTISQLYKFAIKNTRQKDKDEPMELKLADHPFNRLKEIEKEYFGHLRGETSKPITVDNDDGKMEEKTSKKRKKHRKRKKKLRDNTECSSKKAMIEFPVLENPKEEEMTKPSSSRVSLWDVKDMKKWKESKEKGCKPQAFYTIRDGEIIKLEKDPGREDIR